MSFTDYILKDLNSLKSSQAKTTIAPDELASAVYIFLMSKKFRKYAVNLSYQEHILSAIKDNIAKNEPIKLTLVFGGYKLWRLEESPEVDWAELFSLIYYTKWVKPILEVYKPGVWFDFFSDDVILERMNNVSKSETENYAKSFRDLLEFIKPFVPENLSFTFNRVGDQYANLKEFNDELDKTINSIRDEVLNVPLTPGQISAIELNVKLTPGQTDNLQWKEEVNLMHEAYAKSSKRRPYYRTPEKIMIITRPIKDSLAVGTTKRSVVKFWIGTGVAEKDGNDYNAHIYSPKQLSANNFTTEEANIPGLNGKNFKSIRIIDN